MTRTDIEQAVRRIRPHIAPTPIEEWTTLVGGATRSVPVMREDLQKTGSFKARGAFNALLSADPRPARVTAASGGNHGAGVACAAAELGLPARIFVPVISSPVKVAKIRGYGAEVVVEGERYADALARCEAYARDSGAMQVHAFDAEATVAGQGTAAYDWEAQLDAAGLPLPDTVLVAVGGGGLIAGIASWWGGRVRIVGVEPEGSRCMDAAREAGHPVDVDVDSIAADSLGARRMGSIPFAVTRTSVERVVLVSDAAIREAQRRIWAERGAVVEPGGAAAFGALIAGAYRAASDERVAVLICGGNADPASVV